MTNGLFFRLHRHAPRLYMPEAKCSYHDNSKQQPAAQPYEPISSDHHDYYFRPTVPTSNGSR